MRKYTQPYDSNFRLPKGREFLTNIPTNFEVVHLGTPTLYYFLKWFSVSDSINPTSGSPTETWNVHILCQWIKGYVYALACDKSVDYGNKG